MKQTAEGRETVCTQAYRKPGRHQKLRILEPNTNTHGRRRLGRPKTRETDQMKTYNDPYPNIWRQRSHTKTVTYWGDTCTLLIPQIRLLPCSDHDYLSKQLFNTKRLLSSGMLRRVRRYTLTESQILQLLDIWREGLLWHKLGPLRCIARSLRTQENNTDRSTMYIWDSSGFNPAIP
jgi:hypothetical protein